MRNHIQRRFFLPAALIAFACLLEGSAGLAQKKPAPIAKEAAANRSAPAAAMPELGQVTIYDSDPAHLWNRLHCALFIRTISSGKRFGQDELDPLLWSESKHLLIGERHKYILLLLDEFLSTSGEKLVKDPLRRAIFQRDLWSVFDWLANPKAEYAYRPDQRTAEQRALEVRLAKVIRRLALSPEEIKHLPDGYAAAVAAKAFPTSHNAAHPEIAFLPADVFKPDGPWVLLGEHMKSAAPVHLRKVQGRSAFFVFMNLPGGRVATETYLKQLAVFPNRLTRDANNSAIFDPHLPQFPVGTQLALVREMFVIDDKGKIEPTRLIESIQVRVYREIPKIDPARADSQQGVQDFHEFRFTRNDLFAGKNGGLHAVTPEEPELVLLSPMPQDEFEQNPSDPRPPAILRTCIGCHSLPGVHSMQSLRRDFIRLPPFPQLEPYERSQQEEAAMLKKWEDYSWGLLQGLLEAR
jgi:hypothetical protein